MIGTAESSHDFCAIEQFMAEVDCEISVNVATPSSIDAKAQYPVRRFWVRIWPWLGFSAASDYYGCGQYGLMSVEQSLNVWAQAASIGRQVMRIAKASKVALVFWLSSFSESVLAHCDTLDGPVVEAARVALETGDIDAVLIWVQAEHEAEVRNAFNRSVDVRALGDAANELADMYFFETVVRLHREGEGAPYTGLKPAGTDFGPAIPAADRALESASLDDVIGLLTSTLRAGLSEHFEDALSKRDFAGSDVAAGRMYVASYVEYIHYVERLYDAATSPAADHFPEHD